MIGRSWDAVVDAIDEIVTIPDVDEAASETAEAELAEPAPEPEVVEGPTKRTSRDVVIDDVVDTDHEAKALATAAEEKVLGSDEDFWRRVGIDPVRIMTSAGTFYTLRCYLDDQPIFLGRNGRVSVFGSVARLPATSPTNTTMTCPISPPTTTSALPPPTAHCRSTSATTTSTF